MKYIRSKEDINWWDVTVFVCLIGALIFAIHGSVQSGETAGRVTTIERTIHDGTINYKGTPGPRGIPGKPGLRGANGKDGKQGARGVDGKNGSPGVRGPRGFRGPQGSRGQQGSPGKDGSNGLPGPAGNSPSIADIVRAVCSETPLC